MNDKPSKKQIENAKKYDIEKLPLDIAKSFKVAAASHALVQTRLNNKQFKKSRPVFWFHILINWLMQRKNPMFNNGIHYIDGNTGTGKTLLMNIVQRQLLKDTGFMYSNVNEFYSDRVKNFEMVDIWNEGETKFQLPSYIPELGSNKGLIFDEINRIFNRRLNRTNVYNDIFVPLVNWCVTHRHKRIPRIYFIGQNVELQDTQLQSIIRYRHIVNSKKKYFYYFWKNELILIRAPYKIKVEHTIINKATNQFKKFASTKFKVTIQDLLTYNTYGFENDTADLPVYNDFR